MTKPPIPTENSKTKGQHTNATKNFDYTTIVDLSDGSIYFEHMTFDLHLENPFLTLLIC